MKVLRLLTAALLVGLFPSAAWAQGSSPFGVQVPTWNSGSFPLGTTDYLALAQGGKSLKVPGSAFVTLSDVQTLLHKTIDCNQNTCLNFPGGGGGLPSIANGHLLGNATGGAALAQDTLLSALLDQAFGASQGDVLCRQSAGWQALPPGTSGQFLQTQGAGANCQWATASGGGTPGGSPGQVQVNSSGSFGGLTNTQLTADINTFSSSLSGAVPASGGGSTLFLNANGGFTTPAGASGANPTATIGASAVNGSASTYLRSDGAPAIGSNAVTNALLAQGAANTLKGNNTGSLANEADLTVAQVKTLLAYAFTDLAGSPTAAQVETNLGAATSLLCGASTTTFLRGDGTCVTPGGGGTVTGTGVAGTIPQWTTTSAIGNSPLSVASSIITSTDALTLPAGTVSAPALVMGSTANTGIWNNPTNGSIDFAVAGVNTFHVQANNSQTLGTGTTTQYKVSRTDTPTTGAIMAQYVSDTQNTAAAYKIFGGLGIIPNSLTSGAEVGSAQLLASIAGTLTPVATANGTLSALNIESGMGFDMNGTQVLTSGRALQNLTGINSNGSVTHSGLTTSGTIGGSLCETAAGLVLYESGVNCFSSGSGTVTTITLAPGLTTTIGTQNTAGQNITTTGTINTQLYPEPQTANYTVLTSDTGAAVLANGTGSITFTLPNPATGTKGTQYQFNDESGHGYTLATVGATANFTGCGAGGGTTLAATTNTGVSVVDAGTFYSCFQYGAGGGSGISGLTATQIPIAGSATTLTSSVAAPTGTIVGTSDTQTLTNKTINYKQAASGPCALTDASTISVAANCGGVQTVTIAGNRTLGFPTSLIASTNQIMTFEVTQGTGGNFTLAMASGYSPSTMTLDPAVGHVTTFSCAVDAASSTAQCTGGAPNGSTASNCSSGASPAVCASARAGSVAVPTGVNPTLVVNTTAVTSNSEILLTIDESATIASTTCNTTLATLVQPVVTARTAATSFTIQIPATLATNPACVNYHIIN